MVVPGISHPLSPLVLPDTPFVDSMGEEVELYKCRVVWDPELGFRMWDSDKNRLITKVEGRVPMLLLNSFDPNYQQLPAASALLEPPDVDISVD